LNIQTIRQTISEIAPIESEAIPMHARTKIALRVDFDGKLKYITWPQMSDLKYWNCEGAQLYAVSSIPHTVLIDGEGTILARGLHGDELQEKIAEAVK
jgi:hypothetical protein